MLGGTGTNKSAMRRASKPKVRTGCQNCKIRHLKCDECKPFNRCKNFGIECDFLQQKNQTQAAVCKPKTKPLAPKPYSSRKFKGKPLTPRPYASETIFYSPSIAHHYNKLEQRYFHLFCDKTSFELPGYFEPVLWSRLLLQASHHDPAIRHAVIAIGALDMTSRTSRSRGQSKPLGKGREEPEEGAQRHHQFALQQYGLAIRSMRASTATKRADMRTMLLGCILLTCFETFHGNHQSATAQIQSGLRLLEEWYGRSTKSPDDILGISSPSPFAIEDEIIQALGRLDLQSMSFLDPRPKATHDRMRNYGQASINTMPATFPTIKEERFYLELIMRRFMHFMISVSNIEGPDGALKLSDQPAYIPDTILSDQKRHMEELNKWHRAFKHLLEHSRTPEGKEYFLAATALETHYLSSYVALDAMTLASTNIVDRSTPVFREIVSLCAAIHVHPDTRSAETNYTFDLHTLVPLYATGLRCRHSGIRRQAIALLLSLPKREGVWDAMLVGKIAGWVADIEEDGGLDGGFMIEGNGIVDLKFDFDLQARSVHMQRLQLRSASVNEKEATMTW